MQKKCFYCGSTKLKKSGTKEGKQRYFCKTCKKRFVEHKTININKLYYEYVYKKQSVKQLSDKYKVSTKTILRKLHKKESETTQKQSKQEVVLLMDATYRNRNFGLLVFKDALSKKILWYKFLYKKETLNDYLEGIQFVEEHYIIIGGVCDGLKGLIQSLKQYPIQFCQFHQVKLVRFYLTQNPESDAAKELLALSYSMKDCDKESFIGAFNDWYIKHENFINERSSQDEKGKTYYLHKKLRSAYLSLKRNMPYLWVWYDNIELNIPPTNNGIEGLFTDLKTHMRLHNGMTQEHQKVFINQFFIIKNK